jgi:membrane protease YdiL (CAAX protease family)
MMGTNSTQIKPNNNIKTRTIRNLVIFVIFSLSLPWIGYFIDLSSGHDPHVQEGGLGWLMLLISPLLMVILLRTFGGDGWQDMGLRPKFKGNIKWYLFSILFHPVVIIVILLLGYVFGSILIPDISGTKLSSLGMAMFITIIPLFFKNIFEEFAWRGYLGPKVAMVIENSILGYIVVGVVWFGWHLPYYLVLISPAEISTWTTLSMWMFLPLTLAMTISSSILYGEIRLCTDSVWPAVLMHTTGNLFFGVMITEHFFAMRSSADEFIFSPGMIGAIGLATYAVAGLYLYQIRRRGNLVKSSS